ncbi:MAG: 16S rRNA (guanine(527)-N(7))-methyltransferase RsmG [Flavobacteriaceae bacterium]
MSGFDCILHYFPNLSPTQIQHFQALEPLYKEWNHRINVISRKDISDFYERHVLHSLALSKVQSFLPNTNVLDVGTGGGFPGIPLAILFPETSFVLVDSIGKKIKVVQAVSEALGLENLAAFHKRAETVDEEFDFVVSRAVTRMDKFVPWVQHKIKSKSAHPKNNGILYLKGGDLDEELKNFPAAEVSPIADYFSESFFETKKVVYLPLV